MPVAVGETIYSQNIQKDNPGYGEMRQRGGGRLICGDTCDSTSSSSSSAPPPEAAPAPADPSGGGGTTEGQSGSGGGGSRRGTSGRGNSRDSESEDGGGGGGSGEGGGGGQSQQASQPQPQSPAGIEVAANVLTRAPLPAPVINSGPPRGIAWVVNIEGWIWVENWATRPYQGEMYGRVATVTFTPITTTFDPGNGDRARVCRGPGTPWTPTSSPDDPRRCGHTYQRSTNHRKLPATVTVTYQVTWTANDGTSGQFGTRDSPATPLQLQVDQIVSVGTR